MPKLVAHRTTWSGLQSTDNTAEIGVFGVPFDLGVSWRGGARHAPERLRSITPHLGPVTEEGVPLAIRVKDYGNAEFDLNRERFFASTAETAGQIMAGPHRLALFLGGDHSVGIPLFQAFARSIKGRAGYIQFDAHADLANALDGHPWSHACTARRNLEQPNLSARHVAFVGLRSFLPEEMAYYAGHPEMGWHTARDIYRRGIEAVAGEVIAQLQDVDAVYLSLDIDGLDPACAPGTGTPEPGGLTTRQCLEFVRLIFAALPVTAVDLVEVSPPLDTADITSLAALKIIYEIFGFVQSQITG